MAMRTGLNFSERGQEEKVDQFQSSVVMVDSAAGCGWDLGVAGCLSAILNLYTLRGFDIPESGDILFTDS